MLVKNQVTEPAMVQQTEQPDQEQNQLDLEYLREIDEILLQIEARSKLFAEKALIRKDDWPRFGAPSLPNVDPTPHLQIDVKEDMRQWLLFLRKMGYEIKLGERNNRTG